MSKLEKFYSREDAKWAHPELEDLYHQQFSTPSPGAAGLYLNTEQYTFDERSKMRQDILDMLQSSVAPTTNLNRETFFAKGCEEEPDAPEVKIEVAYPEKRKKAKAPCLYYIAGGGLSMCPLSIVNLEGIANTLNCVVVTVHYRTLFDKGGYPQTVNDCHATYKWILENADSLNINPDKIVFYGASSGSHLAMALCHRLKKYNWYGYQPRGCVVAASITDDRVCYPSNRYMNYAWNSKDLDASSRMWLGRTDYSIVPAEAFPNHASAEECIGLPPTFIHSEENDASGDASSIYASKLIQAGVYTELHRWGGTNHGILDAMNIVSDSDYLRRFADILLNNIRDCMKYDLRRQWQKDLLSD